MTPYGDLFFFYIMTLALIPAIILGLLGKKIKNYGFVVTLLMLALFIGRDKIELICFIMFYFGELILIKGYFYIRKKTDNRWIMRITVFLSILPLILVKFSPFVTKTVIGFIGISYITFRTVQILLETYDGLISDMGIIDFTYFILFFPSLSSGPIDRSRNFEASVNKSIEGKVYANEYLPDGVYKIFKGVAYKFLFGNFIYAYWMMKIPEGHTLAHTISYMYAYTLYLFFDFAGYSSIAIGTGYLLGVKLPENFNAPFISRNMKEFWNRWHMSLSFWFRDFIYTRFVMESMKKKRFKSRFTASYIGYFLTMITMGVWHGFKIHYIIYGLYMAAMIILADYFQRKSKLYKKYKKRTWWAVTAIVFNFHVVSFGFLIFSGYLLNK